MRSRVALATAFFALLVVINTYPLTLHPAREIGDQGDAYFSIWRLAWVAHQIGADP